MLLETLEQYAQLLHELEAQNSLLRDQLVETCAGATLPLAPNS